MGGIGFVFVGVEVVVVVFDFVDLCQGFFDWGVVGVVGGQVEVYLGFVVVFEMFDVVGVEGGGFGVGVEFGGQLDVWVVDVCVFVQVVDCFFGGYVQVWYGDEQVEQGS